MLLCFRAVGARSARVPGFRFQVLGFEFGIWDFEFPLTVVSGLRSDLGRVNPLLDSFDVGNNALNVMVSPIIEVV